MGDSDDIVSRADSLMMKRRRSFVAGPPAATPMPDETLGDRDMPPSDADEDIPVLTEVVAPEASVAETPPDRFDETLLALHASDLAHAIEQRLAVELPSLIEASLTLVENELRLGVAGTVEAALKDFIARRQQLSLPLDDERPD